MRKNKTDVHEHAGFTLAEVLITLGIIGVVAAMTMPTLIQKYQKKVTAVRIKKAYSMIYQAVKLSEAENGNFNEWDMPSSNTVENTRKFVKTYFEPYLKELQECSQGLDKSCTYPMSGAGVNYLMNNGEGISILAASDGKIRFLYDLYPNKGDKHILGKDYFYFEITNGKLLPAGYTPGLTRKDILNGKIQVPGKDVDNNDIISVFSCKKEPAEKRDGYRDEFRHGCTALLYVDGWEFKDDYPW